MRKGEMRDNRGNEAQPVKRC